ncbi:OprD family outer membrane porin [Pseudomonas aeruginosa]
MRGGSAHSSAPGAAVVPSAHNGDDDSNYLRQDRTPSTWTTRSSTATVRRTLADARYDLDMAAFGVPGLSFATRGKGWDADYSNANSVYMRTDANGKPADQPGPLGTRRGGQVRGGKGSMAQGLMFRVRQATVRSTARVGPRIVEVRLDRRIPASPPARRPVRGGALRQRCRGLRGGATFLLGRRAEGRFPAGQLRPAGGRRDPNLGRYSTMPCPGTGVPVAAQATGAA